MKREYQVVSLKGSAALREFLVKQGAALVPMVELIEQGQLAAEEQVGQLGKAALEAVLAISAEQVAGPPHPGRPMSYWTARGLDECLGGQRPGGRAGADRHALAVEVSPAE